MKFFIACILVVVAALPEAKAAYPGTVAVKVNYALIQVSLGKKDVSVGDRVAIYKKICTGGRTQTCDKVRVGEGSVDRILDDRYSEVRLDSGVQVSEGFLVERE